MISFPIAMVRDITGRIVSDDDKKKD